MKKTIIILIGISLIALASVCAYAQTTEGLTLTTYYPAPFGAYKALRLFPNNTPPAAGCNAANEGIMHYDDGAGGLPDGIGLYVCTQDATPAFAWEQMAGVGGGGHWRLNGTDLYTRDVDLGLDWNIGIGTNSPAARFSVQGATGLGQHTAYFIGDNQYGLALGNLREPSGAENTFGSIQAFEDAGTYQILALNPLGSNVLIGDPRIVSNDIARLYVGGSGDSAAGDYDRAIYATYVDYAGNLGQGTNFSGFESSLTPNGDYGYWAAVKGTMLNDASSDVHAADFQLQGNVAYSTGDNAVQAYIHPNVSGDPDVLKVWNESNNITGHGINVQYEGGSGAGMWIDYQGGGQGLVVDYDNPASANTGLVVNYNGTGMSAWKSSGGNLWNAVSDRRLKKNIKTVEEALDTVLKLRGAVFEWKDPQRHGNETGTRMGFIAQEIEQVFPQWVMDGPDGFKTTNISGIEALFVETIRELKTEIDALKSENKELAQRIAALELVSDNK